MQDWLLDIGRSVARYEGINFIDVHLTRNGTGRTTSHCAAAPRALFACLVKRSPLLGERVAPLLRERYQLIDFHYFKPVPQLPDPARYLSVRQVRANMW